MQPRGEQSLLLHSVSPPPLPRYPSLHPNVQTCVAVQSCIGKYSWKCSFLKMCTNSFPTVRVGLFRSGMKVWLGCSNDNRTAKNTGVNTFKTHWESDYTNHIRRWSWTHKTTLFVRCECTEYFLAPLDTHMSTVWAGKCCQKTSSKE